MNHRPTVDVYSWRTSATACPFNAERSARNGTLALPRGFYPICLPDSYTNCALRHDARACRGGPGCAQRAPLIG